MADGATILRSVLQKLEGDQSWGFGIALATSSPNLFVKSVKENTPAARAGLRQGDIVLELEGESVIGKNVAAAGEIIKRAQNQLSISYSRGQVDEGNKENFTASLQPVAAYQGLTESVAVAPKDLPESSDVYQRVSLPIETATLQSQQQSLIVTTAPEQPHPISIHHLKKWKGYPGFGFSIQQKADGSKYVVKIEPNTPAFASGVRANSVLCQVNSANVRVISYQDTVNLIKASGLEVTITVTTTETMQWIEAIGKRLEDCMSELNVNTHEPPPEPPASEPPQAAANVAIVEPQPAQIPTQSLPLDASLQQSAPPSLPVAEEPPKSDTPRFKLRRAHLIKIADKSFGFGLKSEIPPNGLPKFLSFSKIEPSSAAYFAGLEVGMVVFAINGSYVIDHSLAEAKPHIAAKSDSVEFFVGSRETLAAAVRALGQNINSAPSSFEITDAEVKNSLSVAPAIIAAPAMPVQEAADAWPSDLPLPRNCQLSKWPSRFKGYGFHLQAERNRQGHYIGKLDPGSPAEFGGLVINWRIVAVNDENVLNESHARVVQMIQASGDSVCMLIAASEVVEFCQRNNIVLSKSMKECRVQNFQTPLNPPDSVASPATSTPNASLSPSSQIEVSTPAKDVTLSPAPPTPPSPLPLSPQSDQNQNVNQNQNQKAEDADLAYLKTIRGTIGTRRLKDARRQPNRDIKQAFDLANSL